MKWTRVVILLVLLFAMFGCAAMNRADQWPYRGGFVCATNNTTQIRSMVAQDGAFRTWPIGVQRMRPLQRECARWPFIQNTGRLGLATATDTVWSVWFNPWSDASLQRPDKIGEQR